MAATLTINSNDPVNPALPVSLSGTGVAPIASLSRAAIAFGNQPINTTSAAQTVTLTNTGTANLTFTAAVRLGGANANQFAQTNNCPGLLGSLAPGASCTVSVTFHPTVRAARSASVIFADNATPATQTVTLTGTGQ